MVVLYLIGFVTICPVVCGAGEGEGGPDRHAHGLAAQGPTEPQPSAPFHCPEESESCICQGAVQAADVRVPGPDALGVLAPRGGPSLAAQSVPPQGLAHHLTRDGQPTGLAHWGNSTAVRALLQNFRC